VWLEEVQEVVTIADNEGKLVCCLCEKCDDDVVLTLGSYGVMDRRYLTFCHRHCSPSFKEDREVGYDSEMC